MKAGDRVIFTGYEYRRAIQYHYADKLIGDYDLDCDCDIEELLMNGGVHSKG